jgi:hypothetical protein
MANTHWEDYFDNSFRTEAVESMKRGRGSMRGEALRTAVEYGREDLLSPRVSGRGKAKYRWSDSFDDAPLDQPSQPFLAEADFESVLAREQAELACTDC